MPIYEYQCHHCDHRFEALVRNSSERTLCPNCGDDDHLQRLISAHAIGSGTPETACGNAPCSPAPACGNGGCCSG